MTAINYDGGWHQTVVPNLINKKALLIYSHLFFCQSFFQLPRKILAFSQRYFCCFLKEKRTDAKDYIYLYSLLVSREKFSFFKKYLTSKKLYKKAFPTHRQSVETTTMDEVCQLIFHGFIFFFNETLSCENVSFLISK